MRDDEGCSFPSSFAVLVVGIGIPHALFVRQRVETEREIFVSAHAINSHRPLQERRTARGIPAAHVPARQGSDVTPLAVAAAVELFLTLLFFVGRDAFPRHPAQLAAVLARSNTAVFDRIWQALGGGSNPEAVLRTLDTYAKFERRHALVFLPLYGEDDGARVLCGYR
jgi:hypothetical protein